MLARRRFLIASALVALGAAFVVPARGAPGSLDEQFSGDGKVRIRTHYADEAFDMALDAEGRPVLVGVIWPDAHPLIEVVRLTAAGALDRSFSGNGRRTIRFAPGWNVGKAVAVQPNGRIVVAGHWHDSDTGANRMAIARLLPGGRLDRAFSDDGRKRIDFPYTLRDHAGSVLIQEDGKILLGGGADERAALVRLRPNGRIDRAFGTRGHVFTEPNGESFSALALQPNGRILAAGYPLARYRADGTPDPSFGNGGEAIDPVGPEGWGCRDIAVQKNGKVVCASSFINDDASSLSWDAAVVRWLSDGRPDTAFGGDGVVVTGLQPSPGPQQSGSSEEVESITVQADGKILTAGLSRSYGTSGPHVGDAFLVLRYLSTGGLDASFGRDGVVRTRFTGWIDRASTVELRRDGRIVVGGTALDSDMAVARYLP